ncbi:hypothetical protein [Mycobacterium marseillense]|uniref:Secreted protein n=1 Tax=Mycobacterium marseillense TaxID=701042 RepID=A0ABM7J847_9MYCO|nr:hypothetical protein [Mycobacterium marseillense]MCA2263264.1 hypothetical protein [Mycobacterium marseillense]MCV7403086.1 hypothetical protein [Mycobacterium marseillense]OBJ72814.1 hypothetical protein A5626_23685 [Mycobacterium marseillense]ORA94454.1 hypothetical protein BST31_07690 [Mycobacterium marseillense]BBY10014.1 hypothetical protein MMARJ_07540 [Mycobacterium marseillense]
MAEIFNRTVSRRAFVRGVGLSVPVVGIVAFAAPQALASPPGCDDPSGMVDNCAVQLPEEFTSTSFSTTAIAGGTNYSILFSTKISSGPLVPKGATGYRIRSTSVAGQKQDGTPFSLKPAIGEAGPRVLGARSASSLGFSLDVVWSGGQLVRSFDYTYDVAFLNGLTEIQTCTYMTTMTLADNGLTLGGVGSVTFSPPRLTVCAG